MPVQAPCPPDSDLMKAWNAYKATDEYSNSYSWAVRFIAPDDEDDLERIRATGANPWTYEMKLKAVEGSMWVAFLTGFGAAGGKVQGFNVSAVAVTGLWLRREGSDAVVYVEKDGKRFEAIREHYDNSFSHHVGQSGLAGLHKLDQIVPA